MEFEIDDGSDEVLECSTEEYKRQLIEWWNSGENYYPQHQIYT